MLNFGFRYLLCGGCQKFNRFTEEVCASLFANHITIYPRYELSACHCSAHTHTAASTHTSFLFFPLHHVPSSPNLSTQQVHTHIFHESTVSERASSLSTVHPVIWPGRGNEWMCCGRKRSPPQCLSTCPVLIGGRETVPGNGRPSRLFGLPGDGHYRWHSVAVCGPYLHSAKALSLCGEGQFSKVGVARSMESGGIKDRSPGRFFSFSYGGDQYRQRREEWKLTDQRAANTFPDIWTWIFQLGAGNVSQIKAQTLKRNVKVEHDVLRKVWTENTLQNS